MKSIITEGVHMIRFYKLDDDDDDSGDEDDDSGDEDGDW
jgi:hypothetical protein